MRGLFVIFLLLVASAGAANAAKSGALFDIEERRALLKTPAFASVREHCMAKNIMQPAAKMPKPFAALKETEEYGTDNALEDFSYYLMVHSGRALAGDNASEQVVKNALIQWAKAKALFKTKESHDTYYALKRGLLPIITSYEMIRTSMSSEERESIRSWIDTLVRRIDVNFGGKTVDLNNHRYLADAVLTLWGEVSGDRALYAKGKKRFLFALSQMTREGELPLETRRGARALWYVRQSLANLSMIAGIYHRNGDSLYSYRQGHASLPLLMHYFVTGVRYPFTVLASASHNHIAGPSENFLEQDMGMLKRRPHGRHYMAFTHMYLAHVPVKDVSHQRLELFMREKVFDDLPLIDEFAGGNATCFWGTP